MKRFTVMFSLFGYTVAAVTIFGYMVAAGVAFCQSTPTHSAEIAAPDSHFSSPRIRSTTIGKTEEKKLDPWTPKVEAAEPKPAAPKVLSETVQLKLEVLQLRLEKFNLQRELLAIYDRTANAELDRVLLRECEAIGGKTIANCGIDFSKRPYSIVLHPAPPEPTAAPVGK